MLLRLSSFRRCSSQSSTGFRRIFSSSSIIDDNTNGSTKLSTGITGLPADPNARQNLLSLYDRLMGDLSSLPESYPYRQALSSLLHQRLQILRDESWKDVDVEEKLAASGQLEELVEQAEEEIELLSKIKTEWRPWEV